MKRKTKKKKEESLMMSQSLPVGVVLLDIINSFRLGADDELIKAVEKILCPLPRYESLLFNLN